MIGVLVASPWLAVVVPALLAPVAMLVGRLSRVGAVAVACIGPLVVAVLGVASILSLPAGHAVGAEPWTSALAASGGYEWFPGAGEGFRIGWAVDSLAALMLVVVGVVALMVMVFSAGYMHGDDGWNRYFALLSLFTASMSLVVVANSFTALYVGWELVGACSYLLIGFWYTKPSAAAAAVKAFLTTRVGDAGLLLGIGIVWAHLHTLEYESIARSLEHANPSVLSAAAICIVIGAIGKSAQFPLHAWLPDAMEGPTPVSALIHAATMVAAGVYLVARVWPLFAAAPAARTLLLVVGTVTALGAALAAVAQSDIKRVLAYSTLSQLGFMFAALGVGAWTAAFFHLTTHAAFKALLFLTAGALIHATGSQLMAEMGGLRAKMPLTFGVWLAGAGALAGIPPLSGFFSKDHVVDAVLVGAPVAGVALLATVFVTGLYCARATRLVFFGGLGVASGGAHDGGASSSVPLASLAVPTVVLGAAGSWIFGVLGEHAEPLSLPVTAVALVLAGAGLAAGWWLAGRERAAGEPTGAAGRAWAMSANAFGWDALVDRAVVRPVVSGSRLLWSFVDRVLIDGTVEGSAKLAQLAGRAVGAAQNGDAQWYGAVIAVGAALILGVSILMGR
jgi:NADH-quinone oxidoreductase subunit L